jgi:hypothetical protein
MKNLCRFFWFVSVAIGCVTALGSDDSPATPANSPPRPRLAVLVYFDQMRGDYLTRWQELFADGGFRRLQQEGAWFQNCHYPYGYTVTGAGHASVATGCSPAKHGIVGNDWFERSSGSSVNCVIGAGYLSILTAGNDESDPSKGVSPERLLQPTLADAIKKATDGKSRVVSLSFKDRSAVLPGGRTPDACYWLHPASGQFVTSSYYRNQPHPWVVAYNDEHPADQWQGQEWSRLHPDWDYARYSEADDTIGEGTGTYQGRTFPHPLDGGPEKLKRTYYNALYNSPFGNDLLLGLVKRAIDGEQLGTHDTPDLLCVSFSCNDAVGHCWGPDSQEVLDVTLRSDAIVKELLAYLDKSVGRGRYVFALTADHGICPLPEVTRKQGKEAARISSAVLGADAETFLNEKFGKSDRRWIEAKSGYWVYLNQKLIREKELNPENVEQALSEWLVQQAGIQTVYTRTQLLGSDFAHDSLGHAVFQSFRPDRCGDLFVVVKPYHIVHGSTGTTHGTPHPYDTHVPLLVCGPGIQAGTRTDAVTPQAAATILATALGIAPPAGAEAPVPEGLFEAQ